MPLTRRSLLKGASAQIAALSVGAVATSHVAYAAASETLSIVTRRTRVESPAWPRDLKPLRIALVADPHVGCPSVPLESVRGIVAQTMAERPDMVLLLGDYIVGMVLGGSPVAPEPIAREFAALSAPLGVHAVTGNHDWRLGARTERALEAAGIPVLENRSVAIDHAGARLRLVALADAQTRTPDPARAFAQVERDAVSIVMAHDPAAFVGLPAGPALMVAGHTHGGQIRLPGLGAPANNSAAPRAWQWGHVRDGGRDILVSAGIGTAKLPFRFGVPAEIVLVELGPQASQAGV